MGAKEFFTAIDMLDVYNDIVKQQQKPKPPVHLTTRELGRYRFYIYREKMLTRELERLCAEHLRLEKLMEKRGVTADISLKNSHKRENTAFLTSSISIPWSEAESVSLNKNSILSPTHS